MNKSHKIQQILFDNRRMTLTVDGHRYVFDLSKISAKLDNAGKIERESYKIPPSGYGIYWPLINEDLSIDGLLGISHKSVNSKQPEPKAP
jgi:hypothetical protein